MPPSARYSSHQSSPSLASKRLAAISSRELQARNKERDAAASIVPYLAMRYFHLPGYTYWQDYRQYFANNHPFFGICCHHKLHPVKFGARIFILIGSMAFGLAVTNFIVLYFLQNPNQESINFFKVSLQTNITLGTVDSEMNEVTVSTGQIFLWTVGGALHSMFDLSVWYIGACACCQAGGPLECLSSCKMLGSYLVVFITVIVVAVSSFIVVLRATIDSNGEVTLTDLDSGGLSDDVIVIGQVESIESYHFLVTWLLEVAISLFLWYPLLGTILFTGILGCYRLPFLGGRPRDVLVEELEQEKREAVADLNNP